MRLIGLDYAEQPPRLVRLDAVTYVASDFEARFEGADLPGPVSIRVTVEDGRAPRVVNMSMSGRTITSASLRSVPVGRLRDLAVTAASWRPLTGDDGTVTGGAQPVPSGTVQTALRRQRRVIGPEHLADVAEAYQQAPTRPTQAVADRFGVPRPTAARWVSLARKSQLLPSPKRSGRDPR